MTSSRMAWMDLIRGTAIVLVLVWHAPSIPSLNGHPMPDWVVAVNETLRPFRMPVLMFLSGWLIPRGLRKPLLAYWAGKIRRLAWPYLLWAALHIAIAGPTAPLWHPNSWTATGYLWFLAFVCYYSLLAPLVRPVPAWAVSLAMFATSLAMTSIYWERLFYFGGFFFAGAFVAQHVDVLERALRSRVVVGMSAALAAVVAVTSVTIDIRYDVRFAAGSFAGIVLAIAAARAVPASRWTEWLCGIGQDSLVYYTSHFPVMLGVLALCEHAGVTNLAIISALGLTAALLVGSLLARWRHAPAIRWAFELPSFPAPSVVSRRRYSWGVRRAAGAPVPT